MEAKIPTAYEIRERLAPLSIAQIQELADVSLVPFTTLLKIKRGITENPRIDTVGQFLEHIDSVSKSKQTA